MSAPAATPPSMEDERPTPIVPITTIPAGALPDGAVHASDDTTLPDLGRRPYVLWVEDLSVSFDGFKALNGVTLELETGELRCLIGPNGAGKTTLMDVITGKTRPDTGGVFLDRRENDLTKLSECRIAEMGVGRKFQRPTVFQGHSVYENCELALRGRKGVWSTLFRRRTAAERDRIQDILKIIGLADHAARPAGLLAHGQKQWLEIGMLLAQDPKVLLVDEPVAGMTDVETHLTAELLKEINRNHTIMVVEHDMTFVRELGVKVTCLHEGSVLAEGTIDQVSANERVIEVYLGR